MRFLLLSLFVIFLGACDRFEAESGELGRIVLAESVDGVHLGADTSFVFDKLGAPTRVYRLTGSVRYLWEYGPHAGIEIYYNITGDGTTEPYSSISVTSPYDGLTEDGIGIGTSRKRVIETLGEPGDSFVDTAGRLHEPIYVPGGNIVKLVYADDEVSVIFMAGRIQ